MSAPVVVFDMDDTLYLERDYVRSGFAAVSEHVESRHGHSGFGAAAWSRFERGHRGHVFDETLAELGLPADGGIVPELVEVYRRHDPLIEPLTDAAELVAALRSTCQLALITDGPAVAQRAKIRALGVDGWAAPAVVTAELGPDRSKPHPAAFELVMEHTGAPPERCVYIGDNPHKDFVAPHALGWKTIRVRRAGQLHRDAPSGSDVAVEVPDLCGLADMFEVSL